MTSGSLSTNQYNGMSTGFCCRCSPFLAEEMKRQVPTWTQISIEQVMKNHQNLARGRLDLPMGGWNFVKDMGVEPKIKDFTPKMDGENFMENPMNKWMIWGFSHYFWRATHMSPFCSLLPPSAPSGFGMG